MAFKVGDEVRVVYNDNNTQQYVGDIGVIESADLTLRCPYHLKGIGSDALRFSEREIELISSENQMKLTERFALLTKSEPEKSFIKAGVMTMNGELTTEGRDLWTAWLVAKFGSEFKTEVVDKLLAEQEAEKK